MIPYHCFLVVGRPMYFFGRMPPRVLVAFAARAPYFSFVDNTAAEFALTTGQIMWLRRCRRSSGQRPPKQQLRHGFDVSRFVPTSLMQSAVGTLPRHVLWVQSRWFSLLSRFGQYCWMERHAFAESQVGARVACVLAHNSLVDQ